MIIPNNDGPAYGGRQSPSVQPRGRGTAVPSANGYQYGLGRFGLWQGSAHWGRISLRCSGLVRRVHWDGPPPGLRAPPQCVGRAQDQASPALVLTPSLLEQCPRFFCALVSSGAHSANSIVPSNVPVKLPKEPLPVAGGARKMVFQAFRMVPVAPAKRPVPPLTS